MYVDLKTFQKYSNVYSGDANLQKSYIESAENIVENYLGYRLVKKQYEFITNGTGTNELQLRAKPILKIVSVIINGAEFEADNFFSENEFIYNKNGIFPLGFRNITVNYIAGFSVSNVENETDENNNCDCNNPDLGGVNFIDGGNANNNVIDEDIEVIEPEIEIEIEIENEDESEVDIDEETNIDTDEDLSIIKTNIPRIILMTILRIATLLQSESDSNIGITSKSFGDSGNRQFINFTSYDKYLFPISR